MPLMQPNSAVNGNSQVALPRDRGERTSLTIVWPQKNHHAAVSIFSHSAQNFSAAFSARRPFRRACAIRPAEHGAELT
jgi:hypothetical protein